MKPLGFLTTEHIRKKFVNQFDLVNYAIKLAENYVSKGDLESDYKKPFNAATLVLNELTKKQIAGINRIDSYLIEDDLGLIDTLEKKVEPLTLNKN